MPLFRLSGEGYRSFLQGQTTGDFIAKNDDSLIQTCWLNNSGLVQALLEIKLNSGFAEILVLAGDAENFFKGFERVIFPADKVNIECFPERRRIQNLMPKKAGRFNEIYWGSPQQYLPEKFEDADLATTEQFHEWRFKQGLPLEMGELNGESNPFELGFYDLIALDKGCYLGQEKLAKLLIAGEVKQQLRAWHADEYIPVGSPLFNYPKSIDKPRNAGKILSSFRNGNSGRSYGFAMIKKKALSEDELFLETDSRKVYISVPQGFKGISKIMSS